MSELMSSLQILIVSINQVAYNVGGQILTAETIQSSILGCRTPRPGQVCSLCALFLMDIFK